MSQRVSGAYGRRRNLRGTVATGAGSCELREVGKRKRPPRIAVQHSPRFFTPAVIAEMNGLAQTESVGDLCVVPENFVGVRSSSLRLIRGRTKTGETGDRNRRYACVHRVLRRIDNARYIGQDRSRIDVRVLHTEVGAITR